MTWMPKATAVHCAADQSFLLTSHLLTVALHCQLIEFESWHFTRFQGSQPRLTMTSSGWSESKVKIPGWVSWDKRVMMAFPNAMRLLVPLSIRPCTCSLLKYVAISKLTALAEKQCHLEKLFFLFFAFHKNGWAGNLTCWTQLTLNFISQRKRKFAFRTTV